MTAARRHGALGVAAAVAVAVASLAGCTRHALTEADAPVPLTVSGVGALPDALGLAPLVPSVVTISLPNNASGPVGSATSGNRVILIGDSIMSSISQRYGAQACTALVPRGWQVEVDAETGRFIEFGNKVLDGRLSADWDAAVVLLGNNYLGDKQSYQAQLHLLLTRLAPRPTVLLTTTVFRPMQLDVNNIIIAEGSLFPNVIVVDWAAITEDGALTGADNLHLTESGRRMMANTIALMLGAVPGEGKCLTTDFQDDSMGAPTGSNGSTNTVPDKTTTATTSTSKPTSSSTVKPATTTTSSKPAPTTTTAKPTPTTKPTVTTPTTAAPVTTVRAPVTIPPPTKP
ncbi:unannotated protein [freshwater metagenome]|uniref:Unannotated protein n=1 Tax=freshwater metagenome TaxID=449393 RepID=A0A6J7DVB7_9ZZZZ|nr:hypothetical protein [Actinomycetota bacterium]